MLNGLLPFQAIVRSHAATLPPPSELNPSLSTAVDAVIFRATETEPTKRYPSARAFADALNAALKMEPTSGTPTKVPARSTANGIQLTVIPEHPRSACRHS